MEWHQTGSAFVDRFNNCTCRHSLRLQSCCLIGPTCRRSLQARLNYSSCLLPPLRVPTPTANHALAISLRILPHAVTLLAARVVVNDSNFIAVTVERSNVDLAIRL